MEFNDTWQAVLGELEVSLSKASFTTWFKGTNLVNINSLVATIQVPSIFAKEWFEKKYHPQILKTLNKYSKDTIQKVEYIIGTAQKTDDVIRIEPEPDKTGSVTSNIIGFKIKDDYTFNNFVVGPNNRLAYAASMSVAKDPGKIHNPLVIYGGVGLGKTHLIHAIGNELIEQKPNMKMLYTSCEDFANDYVSSIQSKKADSFKRKYRSIDIFLVDDIQFLSRKEGTQEEFFHTFNALHQSNRQIVMTSDRIPTAIPDLEDRLSSRFSGGMLADIQPPNLETRQAILRKKAIENKVDISQEVLDYIAQNIQSNIRELEGALNRVIALSQLDNSPINKEIASHAIKEMIGRNGTGKVNCNHLVNSICEYYGISLADIIGSKRNRELVRPRKLAMYLLRHEIGMSYPKIGELLGGKDHTTVMHAVNMVDRDLSKDSETREELAILRSKIYNPEI